jgi:hypothetical protein
LADRIAALLRSSSRFFGGLKVVSELMSVVAASLTCCTARLNAASLAFDGALKPLNLRTNCTAEARISSSVAGGAKLNRVLMFLHISPPGGYSGR